VVENKTLVKKMEDIDRRKNPFHSEDKKLPSLYRKSSYDDKQLRKENQMMVKRILDHRATKTKEEIIK
jgi:hypothetical protein